jgi:uncharacterized protein
MLYLIDGYNLLHALGILSPRRNESITLEQARQKLVELIHCGHKEQSNQVTVIFDATTLPRRGRADRSYKGVHISFAVNHDEADDMIEMLIRQAQLPKGLTVVSNDHRIQQAAQRKGCQLLDCEHYMDLLAGLTPPAPAPPGQLPAKPERMTAEEKQHWLEEFADLENDPALKELSDPQEFFDFEEE